MIPKVIHYCWFSEGEKPEKIQKCIQSWLKNMPGFEIKCWNYKNFPRGKSKWVDQAVDAKKFAFAADYIRCYALYHEGGIYLDSDVEVIKDMAPLLKYPYFIGKENGGIWEAAIMGAEKGMRLFNRLLEYYDQHDFVTKTGYDITPMPHILRDVAESEYRIIYINSMKTFDFKTTSLQILPFDYFSPKSYETGELNISKRTYTIHHFSASWHGKKEWIYKSVENIIGRQLAQMISKLYKIVIAKLS